jgi:type IV pilus assembly protein PilA
MSTALRSRLRKEEDGFTLIELMVVVMIIAILMAIAIPTFLGAQDKAKDRAAQSDLRNALTAAKVIATDNAGLFYSSGTTVIDNAAMAAAEPSLTFSGTVATNGTVFVATAAAGADIVLVTTSAKSATAFYGITSTSAGVVKKCKAATLAAIDTGAECVTVAASATW